MEAALYILQPIVLLAVLGAWVYCLADSLRGHRSLVWLAVLLTVPILPLPVYFLNFKLLGAPEDGRIDRWLRGTLLVGSLRREAGETGHVATHVALAEALVAAGGAVRAREALASLGAALEHDAENVQAHFLAGLALLEIGEAARAREHLEYVVEQDAAYRLGEARLALASAHEALGDPALAQEELAAIAERHLLPEAIVRHARNLRERGERDSAREALADLLHRAADMQPEDLRRHAAWLRRARRELREL